MARVGTFVLTIAMHEPQWDDNGSSAAMISSMGHIPVIAVYSGFLIWNILRQLVFHWLLFQKATTLIQIKCSDSESSSWQPCRVCAGGVSGH